MSSNGSYVDLLANAGITFGSIFLSLGIALPFTALGLFVDDYDNDEKILISVTSYANFLSYSARYFMAAGGAIMLLSIFSAVLARTPREKRRAVLLRLIALTAIISSLILLVIFVLHPLFTSFSTTGNSTISQTKNVENTSIAEIGTVDPLLSNFIVSGLAAGFSLFVAEFFLDKYREGKSKPILEIDTSNSPIVRTFHLNIFSINILGQDYAYDVEYEGLRVIIRNKGKTAAQNCKAILKMGDSEEKVSWISPTNGYATTINARAIEYVDLCAFLKLDQTSLQQAILAEVEKIPIHRGLALKASGNEEKITTAILASQAEPYFSEAIKLKREIKEKYASEESIPKIISPTENSYQSPPDKNRKISSGEAEIIITSSNAEPISRRIRILDASKDKKLIEFL